VQSAYKIIGLNAASRIAKSKNDFKSAYLFLEKSYAFRDSVYLINKKNQLYQIDKQFDLTQKQIENNLLIISNKNQLIWITLLVILILSAGILFLFYKNRIEKKKNKIENEMIRTKFLAEKMQIQNSRNNEVIKVRLETKINHTLKFNELNKKFIQKELKDEFSELMLQESILKPKDWPSFIKEANSVFNNRLEELTQKHPSLTKLDTIVVTLICLNVSMKDICVLLDMTIETMYARRKNIKKKLFLNEQIQLDDWLKLQMNVNY
jgi:DNA-binding CsgD family transcriptional regulator